MNHTTFGAELSSSDSNYLILGQIPQVKAKVLYKTVLISDTSTKLRDSQSTHTSDQLVRNSGVFSCLLRLYNLPDHLTELKKGLYL